MLNVVLQNWISQKTSELSIGEEIEEDCSVGIDGINAYDKLCDLPQGPPPTQRYRGLS